MKAFLLMVTFMCLSGFEGCSLMAPMEPKTVAQAQQAVFQIKAAYSAALRVAVAYKRLPRCGAEGALPAFCSKPEVIAQIQRADDLAYATLTAAEAAVRAPEFGESKIGAVVVSAREAMKAFQEVTTKLPVKPDAKSKPAGDVKLGLLLLQPERN